MTRKEINNEYDVFIGIDVDTKSYALTIRDRNNLKESKKMPARYEQLEQYIQNRFGGQRILCAYEAGCTGFGLHDYLTAHDQECVLLSPLSIPKAGNQRVKTNRIDSNKIASVIKENDYHPVRVPQGPYRDLRQLVQGRENYARGLRAAKQRVKSLLLYNGISLENLEADAHWSSRFIKNLEELTCGDVIRERLNLLLEDIAYNKRQLLRVLKELRKFCDSQAEINSYIKLLRTIPGIGFITATSLLGRVGDPRLLNDPRELSAFVGVVPSEHSTGDNVYRGRITRLGNPTLRSLLVEASWVAIRKDTELKQFYDRIHGRHHALWASRKAIVAVARKLTHRIYRVLKDRREYMVH